MSQTDDSKRWLSVGELAIELRVSGRTIRRAVVSGRVPALRLAPNGTLRTRATPSTSSPSLRGSRRKRRPPAPAAR